MFNGSRRRKQVLIAGGARNAGAIAGHEFKVLRKLPEVEAADYPSLLLSVVLLLKTLSVTGAAFQIMAVE